MIATLPRNLSALVKAAAKQEHVRYSCNHIYLTAGPTGYRAEATNGQILAIIQGPNDPSSQDSITTVLVPPEFWKSMLKVGNPQQDVRVVTRDLNLLAAGTNGCTITGEYFHAAPVEGVESDRVLRWPNIAQVLPRTNPQVSVSFHPSMLKNLLEVALGIGLERVSLHWFAGDRPLALTGKNENTAQTFDALLVPFSPRS